MPGLEPTTRLEESLWDQGLEFVAGIDLSVQLSEFNAYVQELVDPASSLYGFRPDVVILAVQTRDLEETAELATGDVSAGA